MKCVNILDKRDITSEWKELIVFLLDSVGNRDGLFLYFMLFMCCEMAEFMKTEPRFREKNEFNSPIGGAAQGKAKVQFPKPFGLLVSSNY